MKLAWRSREAAESLDYEIVGGGSMVGQKDGTWSTDFEGENAAWRIMVAITVERIDEAIEAADEEDEA
jgi:hypothetical protein